MAPPAVVEIYGPDTVQFWALFRKSGLLINAVEIGGGGEGGRGGKGGGEGEGGGRGGGEGDEGGLGGLGLGGDGETAGGGEGGAFAPLRTWVKVEGGWKLA